MNCLGCGYLLWNLPPGACPECGRGFKPSDFEFRHCAVQYACPHCEQVYYGTDEKGHLVPSRFTCVSCGADVDMDSMTVRPDGAWEEHRTARERNPWVDRQRVGWVKGWLSAVGQGMVRPHRLIGATPAAGGNLEAGAFFAVTTLIYHVVGLLPLMAFMAVIAVSTAGSGGGFGGGSGPGWAGVVGMGGVMLVPLAGVLVFAPLWALAAHGLLRATGKTEHGLGRTWQAVCYGSGANWAAAVPCLGLYFFWLGWGWWIVSGVLMVAKGQAVSGLRATFAVLLLPVVVMAGGAGWIGWQIYDTFTMIGSIHMQAQTPANSAANTQTLAVMLLSYQAQHGRPPVHGTELADAGGVVTAFTFVDPNTLTTTGDVPLGAQGKTLDDLLMASPSAKVALAQAAAGMLPAKVIAHRVGDYVFTHHGVALDSPQDPGLWTVILWADPDANGKAGHPWAGDVWVGEASGAVTMISRSGFAAALQAQNQLRAAHGLAALPDPETVTHGQPAAGP